MSESIIDRLSRFTPDGAGLDRDRLLFEAGRASARPNRSLRAFCAGLAATQVLTLALWLWPRPAAGIAAPDRGTPMVFESAPPIAPAPALLALREQALATEGDLPAAGGFPSPVVSGSPWHAVAIPASMLD
jgi:hypothetical protein